ncbi:hypothetical protein SFA35_12975 [Pseudomonas sp. HR96]|uniref:hypothetical protein n=1 Tax=Pseudomonas sp. HR96 TaxID=1027966 RepID=UPI002A752A0E|nr:hypothetical protein [Pseudomonas sp. HR96]WPO97584.1 hypothetical protein SFA35_12975 [Pseudomonas sp. HR96]
MIAPDQFDFIFSRSEAVKDEVCTELRDEIKDSLGLGFAGMFPGFSGEFPLATAVIENHWEKPVLAFRNVTSTWLPFLIAVSADRNIFFKIKSKRLPTEGLSFDESHYMLPEGWLESYRSFESFYVTEGSRMPISWKDTPTSYAGRLSIEQYCRELGVSFKSAKAFKKAHPSSILECWLITKAGDGLFINAMSKERKALHIRNGNFDDIYVLEHPTHTLDRYLEHYLLRNPGTFDFRDESAPS